MPKVRLNLEPGVSVDGYLDRPKKPSSTLLILAHGAGGGMDAPLLAGLCSRLSKSGYACLRFHFLYRQAGRKAPDNAAKLERTYRQVLVASQKWGPFSRVVIGGKSMGGRMATHIAAQEGLKDGVLLLGYPLHAPGKKDKPRDAHLPSLKCPSLFVQGTRDNLCDLTLLRPTLKRVKKSQLHVVDGGDHSLDVRKMDGVAQSEVYDRMTEVICKWLEKTQ